MPYIFIFAFGAAVGSFVNTCVYRVPRGVSVVSPRSVCPVCGKTLRARDLVPLASYALLRGKCASCGARISPRYPAVEFLCGALWATLLWRFGLSFEFACYAALCSALLAVFFVDLEWMRIPNALTLFAMLPALAALVRYEAFLSGPERFRSAYGTTGAAAPFLGLAPCAFFAVIYVVTAALNRGAGAVGMGDIKLLAPLGLALGARQCAFAAFVAVALGGVAGIALLAAGVKKRKDPVPFGPFLVVGAYAAIFVRVSGFFSLPYR